MFRRFIQSLFVLAIAAPVVADNQAPKTLRVYFVGNSVTDTIKYGPLACKRRSETGARGGACVTVEKRGALEPTRGRVSKTCNGTTATSLPPLRGSRECTRTWNCGAKCVAGC